MQTMADQSILKSAVLPASPMPFFNRLPDGDVPAVVELLLQLQPLVVGVDDPVLVLRPRPP